MFETSTWLGEGTAFVAALIVSAVLTPIVRKYALRWKLGDKPNGRRIHTNMIPHLGGIALVLGTFFGVTVAGVGSTDWSLMFQRMLPAVVLIVALGLIDDMKSLRASQKLFVQVMCAGILALSGFLLYTGVSGVDTTNMALVILSCMFFIGMSSAVNLVDGHDGLAAGVSLISAVAFAVIASLLGSQVLVLLSLALAGACAGFLIFNFPPGRIFMGDTGSMFLGVMLAMVACSVTALRPTVDTFVGICFILGVPILDVLLAVARRVVLRSSVFAADSLHMHHVLSHQGFSPRQVLLVIYTMQAVFAAVGVMTMTGLASPVFFGAGFMVLAFGAFLRIMVASRPSGGRVATGMTAASSIPLKGNIPSQRTTAGR